MGSFYMTTERTVKAEFPRVPECFRGEAPDEPWRARKAVRIDDFIFVMRIRAGGQGIVTKNNIHKTVSRIHIIF